MAFDVTAGTGKTISADVYGTAHNIASGEQTQFVAIGTGTLGALALATVANPFPVTMSLGGAAVVGGAGAVTSATPRTTLASDDPAVASLSVIDDWDSTDACKVVRPTDLISVTLSLDTSAYASGDLLADTQAITAALRVSGGTAELVSMMVVDEDDQGVAFTVFVTSSSATAGTENSAPSISDANARSIQAIIPVATGDYVDLGGVRVAQIKNIGAVVKGVASADLNVFVVNGAGTPTFTASGVKLVFGFRQN